MNLKTTWKTKRRNFHASIMLKLLPKRHKKLLQNVLNLFTPFDVGIPLVRVGSEGDGGYLLPDDLQDIAALFSPGVSTEIGFDLAVMNRGIPSFMIDASIDELVQEHPLATFEKLFLGAETNGTFISLDDWVTQKVPGTSDLLLQMDIEGAEYDVIMAASQNTLNRFRIMVIEFHGMHKIFRKQYFEKYQAVMEKLSKNFVAIHLHANNAAQPVSAGHHTIPPVFEVTFIRRDRFSSAVKAKRNVKHELDQPNTSNLPDFDIPTFWTVD